MDREVVLERRRSVSSSNIMKVVADHVTAAGHLRMRSTHSVTAIRHSTPSGPDNRPTAGSFICVFFLFSFISYSHNSDFLRLWF